MMTSTYLVALALAGQLTTAHGEVSDDKNASITVRAPGSVAADAPSCPGPPPPPQECMRVICIVNDESWDYVPLPAGTSCRQGTGQCDGEGTCLVPPVPVSVLAGLFLGTIQADASSSARISLGFSGAPENLSGRLDLGPGALLDCHGLRDVAATNGIFLQGLRTGINGDGSTNYWFTGELPLSEADVAIQVSGAQLSPDSLRFTGTARLLVMPHLPVDDCVRHWPFATAKVEDREVPSVIDMREEEAFATLQAEGFTVSSSSAVDRRCNFIGVVMRQNPPAGTLALPGSLVQIVIGKRPRVCPRL
jgi:PASTA domain-containing protein